MKSARRMGGRSQEGKRRKGKRRKQKEGRGIGEKSKLWEGKVQRMEGCKKDRMETGTQERREERMKEEGKSLDGRTGGIKVQGFYEEG